MFTFEVVGCFWGGESLTIIQDFFSLRLERFLRIKNWLMKKGATFPVSKEIYETLADKY